MKKRFQPDPAFGPDTSTATLARKDPDSGLKTRSRWKNFVTRTIWTGVMLAGFLLVIVSGPRFVVLMVVVVQTIVFKEVINMAHQHSIQRKLPWFRAITWYFLFITMYFLYGETLTYSFRKLFMVDAFLLPFTIHHRFISYSLYTAGIVMFVTNLKKGFYKFQFSRFAWTHMALLLIICQSHFVINNIFDGLICLVIWNDIMAFIFGFFFGRTSLIKVSPKKTLEGFVGAFVTTVIFAFFFARFLASFDFLICPWRDWTMSAFSDIRFSPNPVFYPFQVQLSPFLGSLAAHLGLDWKTIQISPIQLHAVIMAVFSSLIAPFGGFFASGFKRAFKIKDFSDTIPGHGGLTDRLDCQVIMGLFSHVYISSFVRLHKTTVDQILTDAINGLDTEDLIDLYKSLNQYLSSQGVLWNAR